MDVPDRETFHQFFYADFGKNQTIQSVKIIHSKDAATDVAIVKIDVKESLPTIRLGDSDNLQVGEWVMAVGNPFGLDSSVSSGIVSGKGRHIGEATIG